MSETTATEVKAPRVPRVREGVCHHCGDKTKGGLFLAGHDAKLKGELQRVVTNTEGRKADRIAAGAEIAARGWDARKPLPEDVQADVTEYLDKHGAERVIKSAASRRSDRHAEEAAGA